MRKYDLEQIQLFTGNCDINWHDHVCLLLYNIADMEN